MKIYGDQGTFRAKSKFGTPRVGLGVRSSPPFVARMSPLPGVPVSVVSPAVSRGASGGRSAGTMRGGTPAGQKKRKPFSTSDV